ncbi:unnamed protein product [Strongylus vulgaris]|uniref:Uncharacterized protein n=1 Tax=Strongylus vulgaris TaxID=40348 RepID=A0A3P7KIU5_STRVU|nr:unnamed protein product [Strongylus vulgaris]
MFSDNKCQFVSVRPFRSIPSCFPAPSSSSALSSPRRIDFLSFNSEAKMDDDDTMYDSADEDLDDYYNDYDADMNPDDDDLKKAETEDAEFECLNFFQVECVLNESVASLAEKAAISPTLARMLLHANEWDVNKVSRSA